MWRGGGRLAYRYPPLSSGGASLVRPWLRFHIPLIEPDRRIARIRLSDKTSRLRPRRAATKLSQAYEPEVLVKVREGIGSALASPDLVLEAQPPAQPHSRVVVEHPIRCAGGSNTKVIGPSAQRVVQLIHQPCGLLPSTRSVGQRVDSFDHALDARLRRSVAQPGLARLRRVHPPERIPQEVELPVRNPADPCLLLVHCQLQLAHEFAQVVQRLLRAAPLAQDHKVSRARESHPRALAEPDVRLSPHPAPIVQPRPCKSPQWANSHGCRRATRAIRCAVCRRWRRKRTALLYPRGSSRRRLTPGQSGTTQPQPLHSSSITEPSSLLRAAPPLCPASVLSSSWGPPIWTSPFASGRQVPTFRTRARFRVTPPSCRMPSGPQSGHPPDSSRVNDFPPVSTSPIRFRHVISGLLALVSLNPT